MSTPPNVVDLAALYEDAPCGLVLTSHDDLIHYANATFCRWVGLSKESLQGKRRFQELLTAGGRIFHQTHWSPLLRLQGAVAEIKVDVIHADGRALPMMLNAQSRDHQGARVHELALFPLNDRHKYESELLEERRRAQEALAAQVAIETELRRTSARLKVALEAANLHIWHIDCQSMTQTFGDEVALLLGHASPKPISQDEFLSRVRPEDRHALVQALEAALDPATDLYRCVFRLHGIDGVDRILLSLGRTQLSSDRRCEYITGVFQDITELSQQRVAAEDRAAFAEEMMGIVSHDLRNPLHSILLTSEMLAMQSTTEKNARLVAATRKAAGRATRLVSDLLDFTQARVGRGLSVMLQPVDIATFLAECVDELALTYPDRKLEYKCELPVPTTVQIDPDRIQQMVGNLVSNAMAYGDAATTVKLSVAFACEGIAIDVHNEGTPIPDHIMPALFEPLKRGVDVHSETRSIGLGLFIVHQIAKAHHAQIAVVSTAERGTSFTVSIPRTASA